MRFCFFKMNLRVNSWDSNLKQILILLLMAIDFISFGELSNITRDKVKESTSIKMEREESWLKIIFTLKIS